MNVGTLKALLEGADDDLEVMIAHQPSYPLAEVVRSVVASSELDDDDDDDEDEDDAEVLWIVAGGTHEARSPYAPRDVFQGWF